MVVSVSCSYVFPGFLTPVLTHLSYPKAPTTFPTYFCIGRGENKPERKVVPTGDLTRNHQDMSPTRSPLSHPGGASKYLHYTNDRQLAPKTTRFKTTRPTKISPQDNSPHLRGQLTPHPRQLAPFCD